MGTRGQEEVLLVTRKPREKKKKFVEPEEAGHATLSHSLWCSDYTRSCGRRKSDVCKTGSQSSESRKKWHLLTSQTCRRNWLNLASNDSNLISSCTIKRAHSLQGSQLSAQQMKERGRKRANNKSNTLGYQRSSRNIDISAFSKKERGPNSSGLAAFTGNLSCCCLAAVIIAHVNSWIIFLWT